MIRKGDDVQGLPTLHPDKQDQTATNVIQADASSLTSKVMIQKSSDISSVSAADSTHKIEQQHIRCILSRSV